MNLVQHQESPQKAALQLTAHFLCIRTVLADFFYVHLIRALHDNVITCQTAQNCLHLMLLGLLGNAYCKKGFHVFDTILWQRGGFLSADVVFHFCRITIHFHIANMGFLYFLMLKKQRTFHLSRYLYTVKEIVLLHIYNIHTWGHYVISHLNYNPILPIIILTKQIRKIILPVWSHWQQV